MTDYIRNPELQNKMLPADIVLAPAWWYKHEGISFDEDFFYNPNCRVEAERKMERALYERWGKFGLGKDHNRDLPQLGPVHLASGYMLSQMLGCKVKYSPDNPPEVLAKHQQDLSLEINSAFETDIFKKFTRMTEQLKSRHGGLVGDVNWGGVLNIAMDLRGQAIFMDMFDKPEQTRQFFDQMSQFVERFVKGIEKETGTSSTSVNRTVRHFKKPVYLHSECSHTMISCEDYEKFLMDIDLEWSKGHRPFGIHYCGTDPHRYAETFAKIPYLDFLDVGWGGDVKKLREHLPNTFLNIRLSPVEIINQSVSDIGETILRLVKDSGNPYLTGVCCINIDEKVCDEKITVIFETVEQLRKEYSSGFMKTL